MTSKKIIKTIKCPDDIFVVKPILTKDGKVEAMIQEPILFFLLEVDNDICFNIYPFTIFGNIELHTLSTDSEDNIYPIGNEKIGYETKFGPHFSNLLEIQSHFEENLESFQKRGFLI